VEKAPHADADRIRHIDGPALVEAIDLGRPELAAVRRVHDSGRDAVAELLAHFASGRRPTPIPSPHAQMAALGEHERQGILAAAEQAARTGAGSFTDRGLGRSRLYGHHYLGWTRPLLQAYALTGDTSWLTTWGGVFDSWYAVRDEVRGDWPGLDVIWYTLGVASRTRLFADAVDLAGGHTGDQDGSIDGGLGGGAGLSAATRVRLLGSVLGGARWLAEEHDSFRYGNWQFFGVCTLATLAGLFPEFAEADTWADIARTRIEEHLVLDVDDDGGHLERSPGYHQLCVTSLHDAALHADAYLGWDLGRHPRVKLMYDWLVKLATPEGWLPAFQDSGHVQAGPSLVRGHYLLGEPAYKGVADRVVPPDMIRSQLAPLPARDGTDPYQAWQDAASIVPDQPLVHLPASKYVVVREGWQPGGLYAAMNCGPEIPHELESHSHRACLDFVLWGHGAPLAWEAGGPQSYDDPSYYSWFQAPEAHNTVMSEGLELSRDRDGTVELAEHLGSLDVVVAHHDGWGPRHRRTLVFVRPDPVQGARGYWIVHDELGAPGPWRWLLHGLSPWVERASGTFASADAPGLVAHLPELWSADGPQTWRTTEGVTSVPGADGPSWQALYCLDVQVPRRHLTAVLVPIQEPAQGDVRVAPTDSGAVGIAADDWVDEFAPGSWTRRSGAHVMAAAAWDGSGAVSGRDVVVQPSRSRTLRVHWGDGGADGTDAVVAEVEATHRTTITLAVGRAGDAQDVNEVRLDGIAVPYEQTGANVSVTVPGAGRWTIQVMR
jgi:Heparinase II/III-like protein/Heparinase II/III N-terminus